MCPASSFLRALLKHVVFKESSFVILDMEAGIEHLGRGTTRGIDLMIIVVERGSRSIETASRIKDLAGDIGIGRLAAVINKVRDAEIKEIESRLDSMGIPVLGSIPYDNSMITADLNNQSPVETEGSALEALKEIKNRLIAGEY